MQGNTVNILDHNAIYHTLLVTYLGSQSYESFQSIYDSYCILLIRTCQYDLLIQCTNWMSHENFKAVNVLMDWVEERVDVDLKWIDGVLLSMPSASMLFFCPFPFNKEEKNVSLVISCTLSLCWFAQAKKPSLSQQLDLTIIHHSLQKCLSLA